MFIKELEQEDAVAVLLVVKGGEAAVGGGEGVGTGVYEGTGTRGRSCSTISGRRWGSSSRWRGGSRNRCL